MSGALGSWGDLGTELLWDLQAFPSDLELEKEDTWLPPLVPKAGLSWNHRDFTKGVSDAAWEVKRQRGAGFKS